MHRTNRIALACAVVIGVAGAAAGQQTDAPAPVPALTATPEPVPPATGTPIPSATPTPAQTGGTATYPSLPDSEINADFSRSLGAFPTVEAAVAAAEAASLPSGAYGTAIVHSEVLAINAAGTVYHLAWLGGSGSPQRPPTPPKGQQ